MLSLILYLLLEQFYKKHSSTMRNSKRLNSRKQQNSRTIVMCNKTEFSQIKASSSVVERRSYHSACVYEDMIYIFGGYQTSKGILSDFLKLDIHKQEEPWMKISHKNSPSGRHCHTAIAYNDKMYIFGGKISPLNSSNELWQYSFLEDQWDLKSTSGDIPSCIDSHQSAQYKDQMIVYGGYSQGQYQSNVFLLNLKTFQWKLIFDCKNSQQKFPECRVNCSINIINNKLFIFGGGTLQKKFDDMWTFDLQNYTFQNIITDNIPQERSGHTSVFYENILIFFGGIKGITHQKNDLFIYDPIVNTWKQIWKEKQEGQVISTKLKRSVRKTSQLTSKRALTKPIMKFGQSQNTIDSCPVKKYHTQLKESNYYNNNKPQITQNDKIKGKSDVHKLLIFNALQLVKQIQQPQYSPSLQLLNNSLMFTFPTFNNRLDISNSLKYKSFAKKNKKPKPRDGHTAVIVRNKMVIFGGDQHTMSFNNVLIIDLETILNDYSKQFEQNSSSQQINEKLQQKPSTLLFSLSGFNPRKYLSSINY